MSRQWTKKRKTLVTALVAFAVAGGLYFWLPYRVAAVQFFFWLGGSRQRDKYFQRFTMLEAAVSIPQIDIDRIEAHVGCRAKRGATVYVDALTGQVSPCIRAPLESPQCNTYHPARPGRLAEILHSRPFCQYRQDKPELGTCEAFGKTELTLLQHDTRDLD